MTIKSYEGKAENERELDGLPMGTTVWEKVHSKEAEEDLRVQLLSLSQASSLS